MLGRRGRRTPAAQSRGGRAGAERGLLTARSPPTKHGSPRPHSGAPREVAAAQRQATSSKGWGLDRRPRKRYDAVVAKVLIIDDDFEIVSILTEILKREGHDVESAPEPVEGMQKSRKVKPDLIILDYHMPGNTGAHLFESLRRNSATQATPILFMSGEASPDQILSEITDTDNSRFLPKPVPLDEFRKTIRELLAAAKKEDRDG
jgi:CheY-like chemotaxis protein